MKDCSFWKRYSRNNINFFISYTCGTLEFSRTVSMLYTFVQTWYESIFTTKSFSFFERLKQKRFCSRPSKHSLWTHTTSARICFMGRPGAFLSCRVCSIESCSVLYDQPYTAFRVLIMSTRSCLYSLHQLFLRQFSFESKRFPLRIYWSVLIHMDYENVFVHK